MTSQQLARYKQLLEKLVTSVGQTVASLEKEVRAPMGGEAAGGMSNAPLHLGDVGTLAFAQELDTTLLENETFIRDEASAALDRIDAGTFGKCASCGGAIGAARLDALPYARQCVACAQAEQSGLAVNVNSGRPAGRFGEPGQEAATDAPVRTVGRDLGADRADTHAAGTPGGGSAAGGLAGTNVGAGAPSNADLGAEMSGSADDDEPPAEGGASGGAVGGTPANKRATGKARKGKAANPKTRAKKSKE